MNTLLEPLILFGVLFLPGIGPGPGGPVPFLVNQELARVLRFQLPGFALVWYLFGLRGGRRLEPPCRADLGLAVLALPFLVSIGFCASLAGPLLPALAPVVQVQPPRGPLQWAVMALSSLSTGYIEESYFRCYLLTRLKEQGLRPGRALGLSAALFALCHLYEGLPGVLNALLGGLFLGWLFLKRGSLHGLAWAHAAYNAAAYLSAATSGPR